MTEQVKIWSVVTTVSPTAENPRERDRDREIMQMWSMFTVLNEIWSFLSHIFQCPLIKSPKFMISSFPQKTLLQYSFNENQLLQTVLPTLLNFGPQTTHSNIIFLIFVFMKHLFTFKPGLTFSLSLTRGCLRWKALHFSSSHKVSCPTIRFYRSIRLEWSKGHFTHPSWGAGIETWTQYFMPLIVALSKSLNFFSSVDFISLHNLQIRINL